jgi:hypothetical protein
MAASITCTCDVCGVVRGPSNHWLMANVKSMLTHAREDGDMIVGVRENIGISFAVWDDKLIHDAEFKQLCGIGCAIKLLSTTMGGS